MPTFRSDRPAAIAAIDHWLNEFCGFSVPPIERNLKTMSKDDATPSVTVTITPAQHSYSLVRNGSSVKFPGVAIAQVLTRGAGIIVNTTHVLETDREVQALIGLILRAQAAAQMVR